MHADAWRTLRDAADDAARNDGRGRCADADAAAGGPGAPGAHWLAAMLARNAPAEYLRRHPDFLLEHPDLVWVLTPPEQRSGNGVVDMQRYMLERMKTDLAKLTAALDLVPVAVSCALGLVVMCVFFVLRRC